MDVDISKTDDAVLLKLSGELTIYDMHNLKQDLLQQLEDFSSIILDMAGVVEMDGSGLQVLISLLKTADKMGRKVVITKDGAEVREIVRLCNISGQIDLHLE